MAASKLKTQPILSTLLKPDGTYTQSIADTLETLISGFFTDDDPAFDLELHRNVRFLVNSPINTNDDLPFNIDEIKQTLSTFNAKKCPGDDGITSDILLVICDLLPKTFVSLYNKCLGQGKFPEVWKRSKIIPIIKPGKETEPGASKFRPISLLPVAGKLLEKLLINRIMYHVNQLGCLSENQFGFRPQKSTIHCLARVNNFIQTNLSNKHQILLISLDIKGAFDSAWWPEILFQLRKINCPQNLFYLTRDYFKNRTAFISVNNFTVEKEVNKGCPQGSCCGPGFWNLMYNPVLELSYPDQVETVAFADDLMIMVADKDFRNLEWKANLTLFKIHQWSQSSKIEFNSSKCKVLHISKKKNTCSPKVFLNGELISVVNNLKFLGIHFDQFHSWKVHMDFISDRALQLTNVLSKIAKVHWGFSTEALKTIHDGAVLPAITYACPIWRNSLKNLGQKKKIIRAHRLVVIRAVRGFRTMSYEAACVIGNIMPIDVKIEECSSLFCIRNQQYFIDHEYSFNPEISTAPVHWPHPSKVPLIYNIEQINYDINIYTDGSKDGLDVGCAVVFYDHNDKQILTKQYKLASNCSNNQAEILAIGKALEVLSTQRFTGSRSACILTDSQVSLDSLRNSDNHLPLIDQARLQLCKLKEDGWIIHFGWVQAHRGLLGNETADKLAKEASKSNLPISYSAVPDSFVQNSLHQAALEEWNRIWLSTAKGSTTKMFFPTIASRQQRADLKYTYKMTQILSGHGRFRSYLFRFKIMDDPFCKCQPSNPVQDVQHLVVDCPQLDNIRAPLIQQFLLRSQPWPPQQLHQLLHPDFYNTFLKFINFIQFDKLIL